MTLPPELGFLFARFAMNISSHRALHKLANSWNVLASDTNLTPQAALEFQISRYRQMTGEQRLALALDLHEFACEIARAGIRQQHPNADETEVARLLRQRLELARPS